MTWDQFWQASSLPTIEKADRRIVRTFTDIDTEYGALREGIAAVDRSFRTRIELTGADRLTWLHNFTTNQIKELPPGEGHYCFALNGAGRIQFDLHALVREDRIWMELDGRAAERALAHFSRYVIMEDVRVTPPEAECVHVGIAGPRAAELLVRLGAEAAAAMALEQAAQFDWQDQRITCFRSDFCGVRGFEAFVPAGVAVGFWRALTEGSGARAVPCGWDSVEVCRIESGMPDGVADLSDDVLPAETGQLERAVSYTKGCYLGQEIVERMRSRGALARQLVGLKFDGGDVPPSGVHVHGRTGREVGRLSSGCRSVALNAPVGLAILKSAQAEPGNRVSVASGSASMEAEVCRLPFVPTA